MNDWVENRPLAQLPCPPTMTEAPSRSRRMLRQLAFALLASTLLAPACATPKATKPEPAAAMTAPSPALRADTFDAVWTTVRDRHYDPNLNGVDWEAVRVELRPRALDAQSTEELRAVLMDMLSRLGESHFGILPGDGDAVEAETPAPGAPAAASSAGSSDDATASAAIAATADDPGLIGADITIVDGALCVLRVFPDRAAAKAGIQPGWSLVSVDGVAVESLLAPMRKRLADEKDPSSMRARELRTGLATVAARLLGGRAGETKRVEFIDGAGATRTIDLVLEPAPFGATKLGNLPALPVEVDSMVVERPAAEGNPVKVGVVSFNIWMTGASDAIDRAVDQLRACDGMVVDLRGNPGGVGAMSMGVAGHFLREQASLGAMIARDSRLEFNASPRRVSPDGRRVRPFARPLAIVVDERTGSTSEIFAGGLQDLGRARVFGQTSAGMALPAMAVELPNGDVLMHAIADLVTSKGRRLEGLGVVPDETAVPTRAALLAGGDPALDAAAAWITRETEEARRRRAANANAAPNATTTPNP